MKDALWRGASRALACFVVACATLVVHGRMNTSSAATSGQLRVPSPERARYLALGFEPVIADYYWIQAIQLVGGNEAPSGRNDTLGRLMDVVTGLDPWVDHPYRFAALWLTESEDEVRHANRLLARGIAYHPSEWRNRFYLGYNHFFYLEEPARAADILEGALGFPGAPDYLGAFVTRLRAASDSLDTAALFLEQLIAQTEDPYAKAGYLKAFDEIETERRARMLDRARAVFWERHGRDVRDPSELWEGPLRVLGRMPPAHPHFTDFVWTLDPKSHEIVSSYYGSRYRIHVHPQDAERRQRWQAQAADEGESAAEAGGSAGPAT